MIIIFIVFIMKSSRPIDHFARCKQQHFSTGPEALPVSVYSITWDKIQPTEHIKLNQKVK